MGTWEIEGSRLRDRWRYLHKKRLGHGNYYGADGDFLPIDFDQRRPVAYLDIKSPDDTTTETEVILNEWFATKSIPVFIVTVVDVETGIMSIADTEGNPIAITNTWEEYGQWELSLRAEQTEGAS